MTDPSTLEPENGKPDVPTSETRSIRSLHLKDFTAFRDFNIEFTPGINAIIGENATGKTHILKSMYAICSFDRDKDKKFIWHLDQVFRPTQFEPYNLINSKSVANKAGLKLAMYSGSFVDWEIEKPDVAPGGTIQGATAHGKIEKLLPVYIPAKEYLSETKGFLGIYETKESPHDKTVYDLIVNFDSLPEKHLDAVSQVILERIELIFGGRKVSSSSNVYYLTDGKTRLEMNLVAEGWRKFAQLWLLVRNGALKPGSILFWDEPEANLNPKLVGELIEILLMLQRNGVQIFLATHDYVMLKELELRTDDGDNVRYHSLFRDSADHEMIRCNSSEILRTLKPNPVIETNYDLYDRHIAKETGVRGNGHR